MKLTHALIAPAQAGAFLTKLAEGRRRRLKAEASAQPFAREGTRIAVIPIMGPLVQRPEDGWGYYQSYEEIGAQFRAAAAAPDVAGILMHVDSPGGMVAGAFDLADLIAEVGQQKPIVAFVEDDAFSAGYLLASQARQIVTTQTGNVGSIGVVSTHIDLSKALESMGIVVTHIHAGARKVDGSPYKPLSEEALAQFTASIQRDYALFTGAVGRGRGKRFTAEDARASEASVFTAQRAVADGLVDAIGTRETALEVLAALVGDTQAAESVGAFVFAVGGGGGGGGGNSNGPAWTEQQVASFFGSSAPPTVGVAANPKQEGPSMDPKTKGPDGTGGGEVIDLAAENKRLAAELAKANAIADANAASLKAVKAEAKAKSIESAQLAGKVTGTNLKAVQALAEHMEQAELDGYLAELPVVTRAQALGVADLPAKATEDALAVRRIAGRIGITADQVATYGDVEKIHLDGTVTLKNGDRIAIADLNGGRA